MFALAGIISITEWWVAFVRSSFYQVNGVYLFSDVRTWGWIQFGIGLIQLVACYAIFSVQPWGRWLGIAIAIVSVLAQLFFVNAAPWWALVVIAIDIMIIYALTRYGVEPMK
jgi:hypothetical protein